MIEAAWPGSTGARQAPLSSARSSALTCVEGPDQKCWLAGVAKRTYRIADRLRLADEQEPIVVVPRMDLDTDGRLAKLLDDGDLVAPKIATDVVVQGTVRLPEPARRHIVAVAVGQNLRRLELLGPRRAAVNLRGAVTLPEPEPFETLTLDLDHAYGGYDGFAQLAFDGGRAWLSPGIAPRKPRGVFAYPRNPTGRGYFIDLDRRRADGALLPAIEDVDDRLTPARFFRSRPRAWLDAPIPGNLGWVPYHAFPRCDRLTGVIVPRDPPTRSIRERAFADGDDLPHDGGIALRALQGAAPGLAAERLRGDELVILQGVFPECAERRFSLPHGG